MISRVRHYLFWNLTRTLSLNSSISCLTFKLHKCFECKDLINVLFGKALKAKIYFVLKKSTEAIKQKSLDITDFFLMEMNWGLSTTTLFYLHFILNDYITLSKYMYIYKESNMFLALYFKWVFFSCIQESNVASRYWINCFLMFLSIFRTGDLVTPTGGRPR